MGLIVPSALLLLIPLAGVIVMLYLLRMKRIEVRVPTTFLWQKITADAQANRPWQKLRPSWLLALQLLTLFLIAIAAARPFLRVTGLAGRDIAVIIDNSASMAAVDVLPSRLEAAKRKAVKMVEELGRGDRMIVISASSRTLALSPLSSDKAALIDAISKIPQTALPSLLEDAIELASASQRSGRPMRVVVLSDGSWPNVPKERLAGLEAVFVPIGRNPDNAAVTALRIDSLAGGVKRVFCKTANLGDKQIRTIATIKLGSSLVDARELSLDPQGTAAYSVDLPHRASGVVTANIQRHDFLKMDNTAYAIAGKPRIVKALIIGKGNIFLEQALALTEGVEVVKAAFPPDIKTVNRFDIIVWDRMRGLDGVRSSEWFIASDSSSSPAELGLRREPTAILWKPGVQIARYSDLSAMRYAGAYSLTVRDWARPLADAAGSVVVAAGELNGNRKISFGFDILQTDLPLRVSFPILVSNIVNWLIGERNSEGTYLPGQTVRLSDANDAIALTTPSGRKLSVNRDGQFSQTFDTGLYTWKSREEAGVFAVNLFSAEESSIKPNKRSPIEGMKAAAHGAPPKTNKDFYGYFVLTALAALSIEWLIFHRRI